MKKIKLFGFATAILLLLTIFLNKARDTALISDLIVSVITAFLGMITLGDYGPKLTILKEFVLAGLAVICIVLLVTSSLLYQDIPYLTVYKSSIILIVTYFGVKSNGSNGDNNKKTLT